MLIRTIKSIIGGSDTEETKRYPHLWMKNHSHFNPTFQPLQQLTQNETKIKNQAGIKSLCSSQTPSVLLSSAERGKHLHY